MSLALRTPRLRLVACDADMIDAAMRDRERLAVLAEAAIPGDWPGPDLAAALPLMLAAIRAEPALHGWLVWLVVCDGAVVGDAGGHGPPDADGTVEMGFSILEASRGRGLATEALDALVAWIGEQPGVRRIVARAEAANTASHRVLDKAGFRVAGSDGDVVVYRR